ncbi:MAG: hypothetical protein AAFZ01_14690 [Pseudomonadota bacterium]
MSSFTALFLYGVGLGFTLAGLAVSAFEFAARQRLGFALPERVGLIDGLVGFFLRLLGGPYLIARYIYQLDDELRHPAIIGASGVLVIGWSLAIGIIAIATFLIG